jgi:hypothetical protein
MADQSQSKPGEEPPAAQAVSVPPEVKQAIEDLPAQQAKGLLSIILARTTTTFGPDPETAKIIAQSEMHEEDCRLKAYQAALQNKETQSQRDHDFRKKKLNHQTLMAVIVLVAATGLIGLGIYIQVTKTSNSLGGYLILGGGALVFHALGIKPPSPKD